MACIENISVDVTVFMGSYKFVNMIVELYNARREFRQFCILILQLEPAKYICLAPLMLSS